MNGQSPQADYSIDLTPRRHLFQPCSHEKFTSVLLDSAHGLSSKKRFKSPRNAFTFDNQPTVFSHSSLFAKRKSSPCLLGKINTGMETIL